MRDTRKMLISAVAFGLFVALFLGFFRPFGLDGMGDIVYFVAAVYGAITTVGMLVMQFGIPLIFPGYYSEDRWTVGREIAQTMGNIVLIAAGNLGFSVYMGFIDLSAKAFFVFLGFTIAVGLFPVVIGVLLRQNAYQRKYQSQSDKLNEHLAEASRHKSSNTQTQPPEARTEVEIRDEYGKPVARLHPADLVAAESADNYVKLYHRKNGELESVMFRASLSALETSISSRDTIFRSHRTWLVNLNYVCKVDGNARGYTLVIDGFKSGIPVARGRISDFDKAFVGQKT